jgi:GLPGLI family protein
MYKLLIILNFFFISNIKAQFGKVIYTVKSNVEIKKENEKSDFDKVSDFMNTGIEYLTFSLTFNKNESFFEIEDKVYLSDKKPNLSIVNTMISSGKHYFNLENRKYYNERNFQGKNYVIKDTIIKNNDWIITNETKLIANYTCFKATKKIFSNKNKTTTREIVVWFCPEISFYFGPKNYNGLPGLILELIDNRYTFYAEKINFYSEIEIKRFNIENTISKIEFDNLVINKSGIKQ